MGVSRLRSVGSYALARLGKTQVQIAEQLGVSSVSVHKWLAGLTKPAEPMRVKLHDLFGIEPASWGEPMGGVTPVVVPPPPPLAPEPPVSAPAPAPEPPLPGPSPARPGGGALAMAKALQDQAQEQLNRLTSGDTMTPGEKALVTQRLAGTLNVLAKLTGEYDIQRRFFQLPIWKNIERELYAALAPFPEATDAVIARLDRLAADRDDGDDDDADDDG